MGKQHKDQYSKYFSIMVKARYDWTCAKCGSVENIQAHDPTQQHINWRVGIALCGKCHAKEHPNIPSNLFLTSRQQPYWPNISARTLAKEMRCSSRTVIRRARLLNIPSGKTLTEKDKELIIGQPYNNITQYLTIKEIANRLGVHPQTVNYWRWTGKLKMRRLRNQWIISEAEMKKLKKESNIKQYKCIICNKIKQSRTLPRAWIASNGHYLCPKCK